MTPPRWVSWTLPAVVTALAILSLVPVAVWWAGADPRYFTASWQAWAWGSVVGLGVAAVLLLLSRGAVVRSMLGLWRRGVAAWGAARFVATAALVLAAFAVLTCVIVFAGNPRTVDGFADLFQARTFLAGRLWAHAPQGDLAANFSTLHMIVGPTRWFSQYPPGQALVLAGGLALGAWWLLNPLFAVALVFGTYRVARWCCDETAARLAAVLLCVSPFVVAISGSELSHLPAAALGMLAAAAATAAGGGRWRRGALAAGAALGLMAAFRPLDAVAAAVPVGVITLLASPTGRRRAAVLGLVAAAGAALSVPILWYNSRTTGSWLQFGYTYLWGPELALGFHPVLWGTALTPARAVALTGLDLHQLNMYLFDSPFPILVLIAAGFIAGRRRILLRDVTPLAGVLALMTIFFFYWHRDVFYGPRFLFSAVPWFVVLAARALVLLRRAGREAYPGVTSGGVVVYGFAVIMVLGLLTVTPARLREYHDATPVFNLHPDHDAGRAGIHQAVVVIPDGWGSRLIARMWALGVAPRYSTRLYGSIDACTLEQALDRAALDSGARARLLATLDSLAALGHPGVLTAITADHNLRLPASGVLAPVCREEVMRDRAGFLAFSPFLYLNRTGLDGDIVWARDLGRWNAPLFARYPDRALYRYAPPEPGGTPRFTPLERAAPGDAVR
jgi:hypothetical protein